MIRTIFRIEVSSTSADSSLSFTPQQSGGAVVGGGHVGNQNSAGATSALSNSTATSFYLTGGASSFVTVGGLSYSSTSGPSYSATGGPSYSSTNGFSYVAHDSNCSVIEGFVTSVPATTNEPVVSSEGYRELSEALGQLCNASQDDGWHIETEVYDTSIQVAAALLDKNIPTPHVFSHGPKSVVFNWGDGENNLYLTIGKRRLWAAVSSAAEIQSRLELTGPTNNVAGEFLRVLSPLTNRPLLSYTSRSDAS